MDARSLTGTGSRDGQKPLCSVKLYRTGALDTSGSDNEVV